MIDVFAWTEGTFAFYRGVTNRQENFPLGLDTFEILGAGVVNLPYELLDAALRSAARLPPGRDAARAASSRRRSGSARRRARCSNLLDGERTLREWMDQFDDREELLTFLRSLYLLVETDLAELD